MPGLSPLQARDPRLWTRLSHIECWAYMRKRWPVEKHTERGDAKAIGRILERYFIPQSQSRALMSNGVARLWWAAKISYDKNRADPYELTKVLFSTLDITQTLLERSMGRAQFVVHGFLEFLLSRQDELLTGGDQNRAYIRSLAKFLNMHGGVCILDCLSQTEVVALLEQEFKNIYKPGKEAEAA